MSDIYSDFEQAVVTVLQAQDDLASVKTWETEPREVLFTAEAFSKGFRPDELPAVICSTLLDFERSSQWTSGEIAYAVPLQIFVLTRAANKADARAACLPLQRAIVRALHQLRRTNGALGFNCWITGDVQSSFSLTTQAPYCYAVGNVAATITNVEAQ